MTGPMTDTEGRLVDAALKHSRATVTYLEALPDLESLPATVSLLLAAKDNLLLAADKVNGATEETIGRLFEDEHTLAGRRS